MRGKNILSKAARKVRAGNLVYARRRVSSARGEEIMALWGKGDIISAMKEKRAAEKSLVKKRKQIRTRQKTQSKK